jgi:hypothetical protein
MNVFSFNLRHSPIEILIGAMPPLDCRERGDYKALKGKKVHSSCAQEFQSRIHVFRDDRTALRLGKTSRHEPDKRLNPFWRDITSIDKNFQPPGSFGWFVSGHPGQKESPNAFDLLIGDASTTTLGISIVWDSPITRVHNSLISQKLPGAARNRNTLTTSRISVSR